MSMGALHSPLNPFAVLMTVSILFLVKLLQYVIARIITNYFNQIKSVIRFTRPTDAD